MSEQSKMFRMSRHAIAGRKGAHTSWANTVNRTARTEGARAKSPTSIGWHLDRLCESFADATPEQRYDAAESARKAYMTGLAIRSAAARRRAS